MQTLSQGRRKPRDEGSIFSPRPIQNPRTTAATKGLRSGILVNAYIENRCHRDCLASSSSNGQSAFNLPAHHASISPRLIASTTADVRSTTSSLAKAREKYVLTVAAPTPKAVAI